jgi:hypothetical protein
MTTPEVQDRPGGITFVVVLAYIASIFIILNGFLVMFGSDEIRLQLVSGATEDELKWVGILSVVIGVIGIMLTGALSRGSRVVRVLFAIWVAFQIAAGLNSMLNHSGEQASSAVVPVVFGILILFLLFNASAKDFFAED